MAAEMEGVDVEGLERAGRRCLDGAELAAKVRQLMEGIVAALSAVAFFAGPWVAPIIAFLSTTVIPWLRNVEEALRNFGNVLSGRAAAQRQISSGQSFDFATLPSYSGLTPAIAPPGGALDPIGAPGRDPATPQPMPPGSTSPRPPPNTFDNPKNTPAVTAPKAYGGGGGSSGGGGGGGGGYIAGSLPGSGSLVNGPTLPAVSTVPAASIATETAPAPEPPAVTPTGRGGMSTGLVAGLAATAVGGGLVGGGATYAAMRRRGPDTDGSELLGSSTVDHTDGASRPGTLTAADLAGGNKDSSRAGLPAAERTGSQPGAST